MAKSQRLRLQDVQEIHRLIGECRDLGADPIAWRERMVEGLCRLTGAQVALAAELRGDVIGQLAPLSMVDCGWTDLKQRALFYEMQSRGVVHKHPMYLKPMTLPRRPLVTIRREMVIPDRQWYQLEVFNEFDRQCGCDAGIMSIHNVAANGSLQGVDTLTLRRPLGEKDFNDRERRIVECFHRELVPLIGRHLASADEPSPSQLPPRVRETLECLLEGDNEKQVAARLVLSPQTVHQYVKMIYRYFGVRSRGELLARWIRFARGMDPPGE
jgi:DNA-binding CsgD family transcriptional regulator